MERIRDKSPLHFILLMTKISFIFFCAVYLLVSMLSFGAESLASYEVVLCTSLILVFGIPHGAIDHILSRHTSATTSLQFYGGYLFAMLLYAIVWWVSPSVAMLIFLLVSSYHFGESQLSSLSTNWPWSRYASYAVWGGHILSILVLYNISQLTEVFANVADLASLLPSIKLLGHPTVALLSGLLIMSYILILRVTHAITTGQLLREIYVLILIHCCFYLLPPLMGFTLYFVILHSGQVFIDEYTFLHRRAASLTVTGFIAKLLPFSFLSFLGGGFLLLLKMYEHIEISYLLLSVILISLITLPHSVVMNVFYQKRGSSS